LSFSVPKGADNYSSRVISRIHQLSEAGLWDIPLPRLLGWLDGFHGQEQKYFAACLLDSLIYRTPGQFSASLVSLYRGACCHASLPILPIKHDLALVNLLRDRYKDPKIRLVPVICDSDPPSKSGPLVMRRLKKELGISEKWMIWPWQIKAAVSEGVKLIILVDDMLGSGSQMEEFCKKENLKQEIGEAKVIYAPVVAHKNGIRHLRKIWPELTVVTAELLNDEHNFFSEKNWETFSSGTISPQTAKDYYINEILPLSGFRKGSVPELGFGDLGLCFGFSHSTPNNSLPILWYGNENWPSLLER